MKTQTFTLNTDRQGYYNITAAVKKCISDSGGALGSVRGLLSAHDRSHHHQ